MEIKLSSTVKDGFLRLYRLLLLLLFFFFAMAQNLPTKCIYNYARDANYSQQCSGSREVSSVSFLFASYSILLPHVYLSYFMRHTLFGTVLNSALYTWSQTKLLDFKILKYIYTEKGRDESKSEYRNFKHVPHIFLEMRCHKQYAMPPHGR